MTDCYCQWQVYVLNFGLFWWHAQTRATSTVFHQTHSSSEKNGKIWSPISCWSLLVIILLLQILGFYRLLQSCAAPGIDAVVKRQETKSSAAAKGEGSEFKEGPSSVARNAMDSMDGVLGDLQDINFQNTARLQLVDWEHPVTAS